jgi:hypothetical protein
MSLNPHLTAAVRQAMLNAACVTALGNSGLIRVYDSTGTGQPATPETAVTTQVLLATLTMNAAAAFGAAAGSNPAVSTAAAITSGTAAATGTATWFRCLTSGGTAVFDGSAGTATTDLVLNTAAIVTSATVACTSFTVSLAQ